MKFGAMKGWLRLGWVATVLLTLVSAAQALTTPERQGWVTDEAGIIDAETASALASDLAELQRRTGAEVVVVTLKSLQGATVETWGEVLGESWNIGRSGGTEKGALLIVAPNDRKVRIAVGYGLGDRLSDSAAQGIVANVILPAFRRGDFNAGIKAGVDRIAAQVDRRAATTAPALERDPSSVASTTRGRGLPILVIIVVVLLGLTVVVLIIWQLRNLNSVGGAAQDPAPVPAPPPATPPATPPSNDTTNNNGLLGLLLGNNGFGASSWGNSGFRSSSSWGSSSSLWSSSGSRSSSSGSGSSWSGGSSSGGSHRSFGGGASGSW